MEQLRKSRLNCWIKDIGRSKHMLDTRYYEGYEGEGEVKVWSEENGNEDGIVIWIGFFNTILEGCFSSEFQKNGIIECYFCLLYTSPSPRDGLLSRMPSSA